MGQARCHCQGPPRAGLSAKSSSTEEDAGVTWHSRDAGEAEHDIPKVLQSGGTDTQLPTLPALVVVPGFARLPPLQSMEAVTSRDVWE